MDKTSDTDTSVLKSLEHMTNKLKYKPSANTPDLTPLTKGQRRIVALLLSPETGNTYQGVADRLEVSLGTVYRQLKRVRDKHPTLYQDIMALRKAQLAHRHREALKRAEVHSRRYFRRRYNRAYKAKWGFYPWERRGLIGRRGKRC